MDTVVLMTGVGGVEKLEVSQTPSKQPGLGMARIRNLAIGVNFIDIYHRTGLYPLSLPAILGVEAAGVIEALGEGVTGFAVGDRVAYPLAIVRPTECNGLRCRSASLSSGSRSPARHDEEGHLGGNRSRISLGRGSTGPIRSGSRSHDRKPLANSVRQRNA